MDLRSTSAAPVASCAAVLGCGSAAAGHDLSEIQSRVARTASRAWVDALVEGVYADGGITAREVGTGTVVTLWQHADLRGLVEPGDPVGIHSVYGVLATALGDVSVVVR